MCIATCIHRKSVTTIMYRVIFLSCQAMYEEISVLIFFSLMRTCCIGYHYVHLRQAKLEEKKRDDLKINNSSYTLPRFFSL